MATAKPVRRYDEDKLQASIVAEYRKQFDCLVFSVPNGGNRNPREAAKLKWTGVLAGVPDLEVTASADLRFYIECKDPSEIQVRERAVPPQNRFYSLSESQKDVVPELRRRGFTVYVVGSLDEALTAAKHAGLGPRRAPIRTAIEASTGF